jgi:hypothetical protein
VQKITVLCCANEKKNFVSEVSLSYLLQPGSKFLNKVKNVGDRLKKNFEPKVQKDSKKSEQ